MLKCGTVNYVAITGQSDLAIAVNAGGVHDLQTFIHQQLQGSSGARTTKTHLIAETVTRSADCRVPEDLP